MITSLFLTAFATILGVIFGIFPIVTAMPETYTLYALPFIEALGIVYTIPVVGTLLKIALLALSFVSAWQGVVFGNWLYNKIRGSG